MAVSVNLIDFDSNWRFHIALHCVAAARWHQPSWLGQQGEKREAKPPCSLTLALSPSLCLSFTHQSKPSTAPLSPHLRRAHSLPPPHHRPLRLAHSSVTTSSTPPTHHCLSLSHGKGLPAIAVAAMAMEHHRAMIYHGQPYPPLLQSLSLDSSSLYVLEAIAIAR